MAESLLEQLQTQIENLELERAVLLKKLEPIEQAISQNYETLKTKRDKLGQLKASTTGFTTEELLRYNRLKESNALYKAHQKFFEDHGFHTSGFLPSTEIENGDCQRGFAVMFYREEHPKGWTVDAQVTKAIEFFEKFSDKMLPVTEGKHEGKLYLSVFEHTLSEYGVYNILIDSDLKKAKLYKITYGHEEVRKSGTFKEVLEYTAKHHYYE